SWSTWDRAACSSAGRSTRSSNRSSTTRPWGRRTSTPRTTGSETSPAPAVRTNAASPAFNAEDAEENGETQRTSRFVSASSGSSGYLRDLCVKRARVGLDGALLGASLAKRHGPLSAAVLLGQAGRGGPAVVGGPGPAPPSARRAGK